MTPVSGMSDMILATARLADRCGAAQFDVGYTNDEPGTTVENAGWYATCYFQGARIMRDNRQSPEEACLALSLRLLRDATCKCLRPVSTDDTRPGCRWRLMGPEWVPGCDADPIKVDGARGDGAAMNRALGEALDRALGHGTVDAPNRAARRGQYQSRGKKRRR